MGRQTPAKMTRLSAGGEPLDKAVAAFLTERDLAPSSHRVYALALARLRTTMWRMFLCRRGRA